MVTDERLAEIASDKDNFYRDEIKAMAVELQSLRPYKDELEKIAADLGEPDDPFAAWEPPAALRASSGVEVKPWKTRPQGEDALEPAKIEVHEGAWAVVVGTNGKPTGWIDTHDLFARRLYRDQISPLPTDGVTGRDALHAIANLPHNGNEAGHEEAYRAVEALFAKPPSIEADTPFGHEYGEGVKLSTVVEALSQNKGEE